MVIPMMVPMLKNAALVIALVTLPRRIASGMNGSRAVKSLIVNNAHSTAEPRMSATSPA